MKNKYGLHYLINALDISSLDLSKYINVHRTLISKWKNGSRKIDINSPYFEPLIEYIIKINDQRNLKTLESLYYSIYGKDYNEHLSNNELHDLVKDIILYDKLSSKTLCEYKKDKECLYVTAVSIYSGKVSKSKAVMNLLEYAEKNTSNKKLTFINENCLDEFLDNSSIRQIFINKLLSLFEQGFNLELILSSMTDNSSLLFYLYPIIFNKNCKVYTYPINFHTTHKSCVHILEKSMVVLGVSAEGKNNQCCYTSTYTDPYTIELYTIIAENLKKQSTPLLYFTNVSNALKMKKESKTFIHNLNSYSNFSNAYFYNLTPTFLCMDEPLLKDILCQSIDNPKEIQAELNLYKLNKQKLFNTLQICDIISFHSLDILSKYALMDKIVYPNKISVTSKPLILTNKQFKMHIHCIIDTLQKNDNFNICLFTSHVFPALDSLLLWCKKNDILFVSDSRNAETSLYTTDLSFINSVANTLEQQLLFTHPDYKEKDKVIKLLTNLL